MSITDHVSITIEVDSVSVARENFGMPILLGYVDPATQAERVATYADLSDLVDAGFATYHPIYLMAQALLGQNPRVEQFKVGRTDAHTQDVELEVTTSTEGDTITVTITDELGVAHVITRTVPAASSLAAEATALAGLINGEVTNLTATATDENVQCVADSPGDVFYYDAWEGLNVTDETPDFGLADDLNAMALVDDDWYAAAIDVNSHAIGDALAAWIETRRKIAMHQSQDSAVPTSAVDDLAYSLMNGSRGRSALRYHHKHSLAQYPACAWLGKCLPKNPGSQIWAFKVESGVSPSALTASETTELQGKNANYSQTIKRINVTKPGKMASGVWIDRVRLGDWVQDAIESALFDLMVSNDKLPYSDDTIDLVDGAIKAIYEEGAENGGFILADYTFSATKAADQATADREARIMRGIKFGGTFADGVYKLIVTGQIR